MASNFRISEDQQSAGADGHVDRLDLNTPPAKIEHRTGAPPAINAASTGTLLATNIMGNPAFGSAVNGVATANAITADTNAAASGDAGYFRVYQGGSGDTAPEWSGTSGESADSPDMVFDNKSIVAGGTVSISSMTFEVPET